MNAKIILPFAAIAMLTLAGCSDSNAPAETSGNTTPATESTPAAPPAEVAPAPEAPAVAPPAAMAPMAPSSQTDVAPPAADVTNTTPTTTPTTTP